MTALTYAALKADRDSWRRVSERLEGEKQAILRIVKEFSCFIVCWPMLNDDEADEAIKMAITLDERIEQALAEMNKAVEMDVA